MEKSLVELTTDIVSNQINKQSMKQEEIITLMKAVFDTLDKLHQRENQHKSLDDLSFEHPATEISGLLTHYRRDKGFGFIDSKTSESYFFHISSVVDPDLKKDLSSLSEITGIEDDVFEALSTINQGKQRRMFLSQEARQIYDRYHHLLHHSLKNNSEKAEATLQPFVHRWSPSLLKLSMIMQVFIDRDSNEISSEALHAAKSVLDYVVHSTKVLYEKEINKSTYQEKERLLLEYIENHGGKVIWRKLQQSKKLDGGSPVYMSIVKSLESAGLVEIIKHKNQSDWEIVLT